MRQGSGQNRTPLVEALGQHVRCGYARFHVPGHKGWRVAPPDLESVLGVGVAGIDLTEVAGLDDLQSPGGVIEEAEALAAEAFGAERSFFLVNGVTAGIHASVLAVAAGCKILVPRNAHRSVISSIIIAGATPIYVMPEIDPLSGLPGGLAAEAVEQALSEEPDISALLVVHPTYHGIAGDIRRIVQIAHARSIPVIADEAHGAHFAFHPGLPPAAMAAGADISVEGCHKTGGAFTQGAIMNVKGSLVDPERIRACLRTVQTSSPSYVLMASLDSARRLMATEGESLLGRAIDLGWEARRRIAESGPFDCPGVEWTGRQGFHSIDPTRLTILTGRWGDGRLLEETLRDRSGVVVEMAGPGHVLAVLSYADDHVSVNRLTQALAKAAGEVSGGRARRVDPSAAVQVPGSIPRTVLSARQAFLSRSEWVAIGSASGRVSADTVALYPPGIPVLCPGEVAGPAEIEYISHLCSGGYHIHGVRLAGGAAFIRVVS